MRLFVGLPLTEVLREAVAAIARPWREAAPHLKWVHPSLYHFTLQVLGETGTEDLPGLIEALEALSGRPSFDLDIGAPITLPLGPRARVLALGLAEGAEDLASLAAAVQAATATLGFEVENRPFRPHLTLARARRGDLLGLDPRGLEMEPLPALRASGFQLFESELRPEGPVYRARASITLEA